MATGSDFSGGGGGIPLHLPAFITTNRGGALVELWGPNLSGRHVTGERASASHEPRLYGGVYLDTSGWHPDSDRHVRVAEWLATTLLVGMRHTTTTVRPLPAGRLTPADLNAPPVVAGLLQQTTIALSPDTEPLPIVLHLLPTEVIAHDRYSFGCLGRGGIRVRLTLPYGAAHPFWRATLLSTDGAEDVSGSASIITFNPAGSPPVSAPRWSDTCANAGHAAHAGPAGPDVPYAVLAALHQRYSAAGFDPARDGADDDS